MRPRQSEAKMSLIGEHALLAPASSEELCAFHSLVTADLRKVHSAIAALDSSVSTRFGHIKDVLGNVTSSLRDLTEAIVTHSSPLPTSGIGNYPASSTSGMPFEFASSPLISYFECAVHI